MSDSQIAVRPKASQQLAALIGMDPGAMLDVIKAQCFKTNPANVTNEQLAAFVSIAAEMGVNPLLPGMLYAFPVSGGGIIPIMGPSGVYKKLAEHPEIDSWETKVFPEDVAVPPTHAVTKIWRKGRERPMEYTALMSEWKVNSNPNWNTRPRHMLSLRSLKHCANQIIHGIPGDEDDRHIMGEINVTPQGDAPSTDQPASPRATPPPRRTAKGAGAVQEQKDKAIDVETVPAKPAATSAPPPDTQAEQKPVDEKKPEPAQEPKTPEKPAEKPATPTVAGPRDSLKEEERLTVKCVVEKVFAMTINLVDVPTPSIQANVKGGFVGPVFHFGGAKRNEAGDLVPLPPWKEGAEVVLDLFGRVNKKTNKVMAKVEKVALAEGSADTPIDVS